MYVLTLPASKDPSLAPFKPFYTQSEGNWESEEVEAVLS